MESIQLLVLYCFNSFHHDISHILQSIAQNHSPSMHTHCLMRRVIPFSEHFKPMSSSFWKAEESWHQLPRSNSISLHAIRSELYLVYSSEANNTLSSFGFHWLLVTSPVQLLPFLWSSSSNGNVHKGQTPIRHTQMQHPHLYLHPFSFIHSQT